VSTYISISHACFDGTYSQPLRYYMTTFTGIFENLLPSSRDRPQSPCTLAFQLREELAQHLLNTSRFGKRIRSDALQAFLKVLTFAYSFFLSDYAI